MFYLSRDKKKWFESAKFAKNILFEKLCRLLKQPSVAISPQISYVALTKKSSGVDVMF